jgi:DNA-binding MarR family transcriptional regulator
MPQRQELLKLEDVFRLVLKKLSYTWKKNVDSDISRTQFLILDRLFSEGSQKVSDLAEALHITCGAVTGNCDKLIKSGLSTRTRDEQDRRVVFMEITSQGQKIMEEVKKQRNRIIECLFKDFTEEDRENLTRLFSHMLTNLEEIDSKE